MKKLAKDPTIALTNAPFDQKAIKKMTHVSLSIKCGFLKIVSKFRKDDPIEVGFLKDLMLFVVKGLLLMKNPSSFKGCHIGYVHVLFFHKRKLLLKMFYLIW
jgi:hypothetical protein